MRLSTNQELGGEIASHLKEQMEKYRGQAEEMAQRLEKQAAELRRELANSQEFVERMTREMEPQINARLNEAVARAASEFEGATARTAHRRYELMLENTQAVTQEALLKLDARSAEVQALVQSAVNSAWDIPAADRPACGCDPFRDQGKSRIRPFLTRRGEPRHL